MTVPASFAQIGEDLRLFRALARVRRGTYIDVGAYHPEIHSVTKLFYDRGWRGINIEPVPSLFEAFPRRRPRDVNLRVAATAAAGNAVMHEIVGSGLSTLIERHAARFAGEGWERRSYTVQTRRLDEICASHVRRGTIHFLKIDAEGSERAVLEGCDFRRFRPWIIVIEATEPVSDIPAYAAWEPILLAAGYQFAFTDTLNRYYVTPERRALAPALADPAPGTTALPPTSRHLRRILDRLRPRLGRRTASSG
jgi:FkbM family methyltransferase